MMENISASKKSRPQLKDLPTIRAFGSISVNYCKNHTCGNFSVPYSGKLRDPNYTRSGSLGSPPSIILSTVPEALKQHPALGHGSSTAVIKCRLCGDHIPLKNNEAIWHAMRALDLKADRNSCPNTECSNHHITLDSPEDGYKRQGKTKAGTQRWLCRGCGKTFTERRKRRPPRKDEEPFRREDVTMMLVNGMKLNRILEVAGISPTRLYQYIDKAYESCVRFNTDRSEVLQRALAQKTAAGESIYLATDRQDYLVNWPRRTGRSAVVLRGIATVDSDTGFVFRHDIAIDERVDPQTINDEALANGDVLRSTPTRKHSQYILASDMDYMSRLNAYIAKTVESAVNDGRVNTELEAKYLDAQLRDDIELPSGHIGSDTQLPSDLMLLREDYALYAHYHLLSDLLPKGLSVINFADFDSGLRAAFMAAFADRVSDCTAHLFSITFRKGPIREEREQAAGRARRAIDAAAAECNGDEMLGKWMLCRETLSMLSQVGPYRDRYALFPWETKTEVEKQFVFQTFRKSLDLDIMATHLMKASLHQVDTYFQQVRRRISGLERGIPTASKDRRIWHGQHFYRADMVRKTTEILRTFKNYHYAKKGGTPAMRVGAAKGQVKWRDIVNF